MIEMNVTQTGYSSGQERSYEQEIILDTPGSSDWIIIPERVKGITVQLIFSGGASGKIQTTAELVNSIKTGSPEPDDWPFGEVNTNQTKRCEPVSGIRVVQINAGIMQVNIRAQ